MMRKTKLCVASAVAIVMVFTTAAFAGGPTAVKTTKKLEFEGTGNASYFAWTQNIPGTKNFEVMVEPTGSSAFVAQKAHRIESGRMDQTSSLLPLDRKTKTASWNINMYDMDLQTKATVPPGVNTKDVEVYPALFGSQMTFVRIAQTSETLYLVTDLVAGTKIAVKTVDPSKAFIANTPNFYGNWITYAICSSKGCQAYRYDITNTTTSKIPNPNGKYYFAPSPDLAGNVYFEQSGAGCGVHAKLMKWTGSGDPTSFYSFAAGVDMFGTAVFDDGLGSITLYVDTTSCTARKADIYSFSNP